MVTGVVLYRQFVPQAAVGQGARKDKDVPEWKQLVPGGRLIGDSNAALTIVEFGDFECPACGAFFRTAEQVRAEYPNDFSIVFRHYPLPYHKQAYPSARAAECAAAQGHFEDMYKALYSTRESLGQIPYRELAHQAGVGDLRAFDSCFADTSRIRRVEADMRAAEAVGILGTPGLIIDGKLLTAQPTQYDLEELVRRAIKEH